MCAKLIDLTGQKFGRLVAIEKAEPRVRPNGHKVNYWKCRCECGTEKEVDGPSLRNGTILSCGCWRKEKNKKVLVGQKFTFLTVIKEVGSNKYGRTIWLCKCDCGNYHETLGKYLLNGDATSCGCRRAKFLIGVTNDGNNAVHGMTGTRLYRIWCGMRQRCNNPKTICYKNYGGRGIKVCKEWEDFMTFYDWSMKNGYENSLTIDRIDVNGNYEPSNCRWVNQKVQNNNTRKNHYLTYKGITKTMSEWSDITGIPYYTLRGRINTYHWSTEEALETPVNQRRMKVGVSA